MEGKENIEHLCSRKLIKEFAEAITLTYEQLDAQLEVDRLDAAIKQEITYGIEQPPFDYDRIIDGLFGLPTSRKPVLFPVSEMTGQRLNSSSKDSIIKKRVKLTVSQMFKLSSPSKDMCEKLLTDVRLVLLKRNREEIQHTLASTRCHNKAKDDVERIFNKFVSDHVSWPMKQQMHWCRSYRLNREEIPPQTSSLIDRHDHQRMEYQTASKDHIRRFRSQSRINVRLFRLSLKLRKCCSASKTIHLVFICSEVTSVTKGWPFYCQSLLAMMTIYGHVSFLFLKEFCIFSFGESLFGLRFCANG